MFNEIARAMIMIGLVLLVLGGVLLGVSRIPGLGRLPGDILIRRENMTFYFPVATSLFLSLILSLLFYLFNRR